MRQTLLITFITLLLGGISNNGNAQGCVAIRSTGGVCTMSQDQQLDTLTKWELNVNNRYFKSFRHFVGTKEQKQRVELGTEVVNHSYTMDITPTYHLNKWWSFSLDVPILANTRSSLYEHDGKSRHETHSFGVGDIRLTAYTWLWDPTKMPRGNVQVGLGIKLPTGDYNYQDFFYKNDSTRLLGPVDQSIQLGDGGTGITFEMNAFYSFTEKLSTYANVYYLANPREQNGTSTSRGGTTSQSSILYETSTMSVPDQYMLRAGANYTVNSFLFTLGVRDECLPVHDLIGGSGGFRRPGFIISIEPGINYSFKKFDLYAYVPVALERNRTQSVPDKIKTAMTGVYSQGDAAFADYTVNIGFTKRF